uniref:Translation initiation factor IF-2, mitochondrial n=1 Tax=Caenorhabditis tropicalis TaxID=1561998 RepID=A0A1I7UN73_9PELO
MSKSMILRLLVTTTSRQILRRPAVQNTWWKIQYQQFASEGKRGKRKFVEAAVVKSTKSTKQTVDVWKRMSPSELAAALSVDLSEITEILENLDRRNVEAIINDSPLDDVSILQTTAAFSFKPRFVNGPPKKTEQEDADLRPQNEASPKELERRPPIVTIMGHVDHGKTTLLDALRNSQIAAGEFGGITQHIGAFSVELTKGRQVTFLDTPGHAAFASMRARGAKGADIVVLVVAADDGVKEQTAQSIKFAKDANVQLVVAVNKIDKPNADPMRAMRSLLEHDVVVEQLGGDIQCVEVSALQSRNLPALQDALLLQADVMDLKATKKGKVEAVIIESSVVHGIGKVCTLVVSRGTLKKGCVLVAGNSWCRVKTMHDENGKIVVSATPSQPVRVSGWKDDLPTPGDLVLEAETVDRAQKVVNLRIDKTMREKADRDWEETKDQRDKERETYLSNRQQLLDRGQRFGSTLRNIVHRNQRIEKDVEDGSPKFRLIIRTDVEGTLEAILEILNTYKSDKCKLQLVDFEVGPPTEKDIELAKETGATLYTFNVETSAKIKQRAEAAGIQIDSFNVIYRMIEALKGELSARLPKQTELHLVGEGHVLKEFMISDRGRKRQPIAGTLVNWGNFERNCVYKFTRGNQVIYEGEVETMKAGMEVVTNAKTNTEVGLALSDKNIRFKEDDQVEAYEKRTIIQEIDWYPPGF